jgi:hypothetical protein
MVFKITGNGPSSNGQGADDRQISMESGAAATCHDKAH